MTRGWGFCGQRCPRSHGGQRVGAQGPGHAVPASGDGSAAHTFLLPPVILFSPLLQVRGEGWTAGGWKSSVEQMGCVRLRVLQANLRTPISSLVKSSKRRDSKRQ